MEPANQKLDVLQIKKLTFALLTLLMIIVITFTIIQAIISSFASKVKPAGLMVDIELQFDA